MRILIAPDSFKGTISARDVAGILREVFNRHPDRFTTDLQPLSDGGEGFVDACCHTDCEQVSITVTGPLYTPVNAVFGIQGTTAFIELASSSGIELLSEETLDPINATTFGLGEVINEAIRRGAKTLVIGLGGSATHDAGMGMIRAMGGKFLNEKIEVRKFTEVKNISSINLDKVIQIIENKEVICAADVTNPLTGINGAAYVYAKQKGASPKQLKELDKLTEQFADKVEDKIEQSFRNQPGAGAAGGTGFALFSFLDARMEPGFDVVSKICDLENRIRLADVVITGEGYLDSQSAYGKAPIRLQQIASRFDKPVIGIFGGQQLGEYPFTKIYTLMQQAGSKAEAMAEPEKYLREICELLIEDIATVC